MSQYWLVEDSTGKIIQMFDVDLTTQPTFLTDNTPANHSTYLVQSGETKDNTYFPSTIRTTRPLLTTVASWNKTTLISDGTDSVTFGSGLPNPTTVNISFISIGLLPPNDVTQVVTDGTLTITTTVLLDLQINIDVFPYQPYSQIITVT